MNLTKRTIENLKLPNKSKAYAKIFHDDALRGFALRVTSGGAKTFIINKKVNGHVFRMNIGSFGEYTPEQARKKAQVLLGQLANGVDPSKKKTTAKVKSITFQQAFDDYIKTRKNLKPKTTIDYTSIIKTIFPDWAELPLSAITREMISTRHSKIGKNHQARGERISKLRKDTKLSRVDFCKKYNIPETTMKAWEYGTSGSITADNILQLIKAFKNENIFCTADYLLEGDIQNIQYDFSNNNQQQISTDNSKLEIEAFYRTYQKAFHAYAADNLMSPALKKGDLALGIKWDIEDTKTIFNTICIVVTTDETIHISTVLQTNKKDLLLLNTFKQEEQAHTVLNKQEIAMIAPVIKIFHLFN